MLLQLHVYVKEKDYDSIYIVWVQIGPPNVQFIKSKDKSAWNARDVADSVLSDKSTLVKK